ncbi:MULTISPECIES: class A beta-lactamase [unclassified Streptomyces]|uniref:class A beta-lactamase n=1 Tax=unclassified Streptomyces TaxID=2593676 RepID=UPI0008DDE1FD|nr:MULTISPECIES: class A beta-lactamase [unclassified Streptomyces]OII70679.1 class A beta-lactamase [Streptomyces sp. CC77]
MDLLRDRARPGRRALLTAGAAAALTVAAASSGTAQAAPRSSRTTGRLRELEREHGARLGVFAYDTGTHRMVAYRQGERFPMCSLFKPLAAAAVLRDLDRDGEFLARRIPYGVEDLEPGWSPVTKDHVGAGLTVEELCDAAIRHSDNTAANLLLRELGGPTAVTRFCRSAGDGVTRLDRWEPELNSAEPWRETDTTTPYAVARTYGRLVLGGLLEPRDRERLTGWLLGNTTSTERFRKGLPADWVLGDKTGGGSYGTNNDAGVTWPPGRPPIVLAVLTTKPEPAALPDNPLVAGAARIVADALG